MTETLLLKLEEKMMALVSELEEARREIHRLTHENNVLKHEKDHHSKKIADILSLLETVNESEIVHSHTHSISPVKPMLVQG